MLSRLLNAARPQARTQTVTNKALTPSWRWLIGMALVAGIGCRLWQIDHKIYWHDEAYTTIRSAGYYEAEIRDAVFNGQPVFAPAVQQFQQLKPGSTWLDTLGSLAAEDPHHAPLYFWLARQWMQAFGSSILASRLLPVLFSLLSLPLMYGLALELFASSTVAWFSTAILALSPIDILIAQTARQYSLLTLCIIASSWLFLRAIRINRPRAWIGYGFSILIGVYSHLLFLMTWLTQGLLVATQTGQHKLRFSLVSAASLFLTLPWFVVLWVNKNRAIASTSWTHTRLDWTIYPQVWFLRFSSLLFDSDYYKDVTSGILPRVLVIGLFVFSLWQVRKAASPRQRQFVLVTFLVPFLSLASSDLVLGGNRSTVTRYILVAFPGLQLATGFGLYCLYRQQNRLAQVVWGLLLAGSLTSGWLSARADTWWTKNISYDNGLVASYINQAPSPLLITDITGENFINLGNLLALSHHLEADVRLLVFRELTGADRLDPVLLGPDHTLLTYNPSQALQARLSQAGYGLESTGVPDLDYIQR